MNETVDDIIVLDKVYREYPRQGEASRVRALRNISMRVKRGARIAIKGESGSGKSTLLNLLGGLDAATDGRVEVNGRDLRALGERELTQYRATTVGFIFQTFNLLPTLTAQENVELPMEAVDTPRADRAKRATELLGAVGMAERAHHRPMRMSGGEQQRVAIARALANNPPLLLADEPTGNLDRKSRTAVMRLLAKANEQFGTTLVVVTHDPNVAGYCERIYGIRRGKMVGEVSVTARRQGAEEPDDDGFPDDDEDDGS